MNLASRALKRLNSTPSVLLQPTRVKSLDVAVNQINLSFWSWVAQRSKHLGAWYRLSEEPTGDINCASNDLLPTLMRNGVAVVPNFLPSSEFSTIQNATQPEELRQVTPRRYGTGVLAHYTSLPPDLVKHFESYIRATFLSIWGFSYDGPIAASIQHLHLPAGKIDTNDSNSILHIDRFLPAIKIFYFPHDVKDDCAPFGYVPGSHRIDVHYFKSVQKSFEVLHARKNRPFELPTYLGTEECRLTVPANSLVVTAVHGLHRRIPFTGVEGHDRSRTSIRFIFYSQVTKTRLIRSALSQ